MQYNISEKVKKIILSRDIPLISLKNQNKDKIIIHVKREGMQQKRIIEVKVSISLAANTLESGIDSTI